MEGDIMDKIERQKMYDLTRFNPTYKRLYDIWRGVYSRCLYPRSHNYPHYGGRGITICDEWYGSDRDQGLYNFIKWSLSHGYSNDLTIDRIDVNGPYSPDNCRWITIAEQQKNKQRPATSQYTGVYFDRGLWRSRANINGCLKGIGSYTTEEKAHEAYEHFIKTGERLVEIRNRRSPSTKKEGAISKYPGVGKTKSGKFRAEYKGKYLGSFTTEEEAYQAYLNAKQVK